MSFFGANIEYGLHCLLHLPPHYGDALPSSREVAEFQGVSATYVSKIFTKLTKAGIVTATGGVSGGYRLAKPPSEITVLDVVEALDGKKSVFRCQEIRQKCVLHKGAPPSWVKKDVCAIHAVMLAAEAKMRQELSETTLAELHEQVEQKSPARMTIAARDWFEARSKQRRADGQSAAHID